LLKYKIFMGLIALVAVISYLFGDSPNTLPAPIAGVLVFLGFVPILLTLLLSRGFEIVGVPSLFKADGNWILSAPTKPGVIVMIGFGLIILYGLSVLIAKIVSK